MALDNTLSRVQFNQACKSWIHKQNSLNNAINPFTARVRQGWHWQEHSMVSHLGCMYRTGSAFRNSHEPPAAPSELPIEHTEDLGGLDDPSTLLPLQAVSRDVLTVHQYIVYSPTFQVPAFYFTVHDKHGSPLPLLDIVHSTLFHKNVLPQSIETAPHGISMPASNFPLLSQGDHPVTGSPCWYFHPCETSTAVAELLKETATQQDLTDDEHLLHWIETWFLVLCSIVDL